MNAQDPSLTHHPAPHRERVAVAESAFGLLAGPVVWFIQLCAGYALASWPCFPQDERVRLPLAGYGWTLAGLGVISLVAVLIALVACGVSRRIYRRTQSEHPGDHVHLLETGSGRTRFLALWGMVASAGFAVATAFTGVAFFMLPRCGG